MATAAAVSSKLNNYTVQTESIVNRFTTLAAVLVASKLNNYTVQTEIYIYIRLWRHLCGVYMTVGEMYDGSSSLNSVGQ